MQEWLITTLFKSVSGHVVLWDGSSFNKVVGTEVADLMEYSLMKIQEFYMLNYNQGDNLSAYEINSNTKKGSYFIQSPDNIFIKDNSIWLTSLDLQANDFGDCAERMNCSLPFSVHQLDKENLERVAIYSFSKTFWVANNSSSS